MKVLVTGGTGFVGQRLIRHLVDSGDSVRALVRRGSNRRAVEALGAEVVEGDLRDADALDKACADCEVVYHAAARVDMIGTSAEFQQTNVKGTERILDAALIAGIRRFVYISSCGVYHPRLFQDENVINEFTPTPMPPRWFPYGRAKLQAERAVRKSCGETMEWVIIRLGCVYGPGNKSMYTHLAPALRDDTMNIVGDGRNEICLIYVDDAVRAIFLAGRCPDAAGKVLIAVGTEQITQQQYFDALADGFKIPRIRRRMPYKLAYSFGWLGELLIRGGHRRATIRRATIALAGLPQRIRCDFTQDLLNWRPIVKFQSGIQAAFEWYEAEFGEPG